MSDLRIGYLFHKTAAYSAYYRIRDNHFHTKKMIDKAHERKSHHASEAKKLLTQIHNRKQATDQGGA